MTDTQRLDDSELTATEQEALDRVLGRPDAFAPVSYDAWKKVACEALKGGSFEKRLITRTLEDIEVAPLYDSAAAAALPDYARRLVDLGWRDKPGWRVGTVMGARDVVSYHKLALAALQGGADCLRIDLDAAVTDDLERQPLGNGVFVGSVAEVERLLQGIHPQRVSFFVNGGANGLWFRGAFLDACKNTGVDARELDGVLGVSPLSTMAARGGLRQPLSTYLDAVASSIETGAAPGMRTLLASGVRCHDGGGNAVLELVWVLSELALYMNGMLERGVTADAIVDALAVEMSVGNSLFMEVAKLRALRLLFDALAGRMGASSTHRRIPVHVRTSWRSGVQNDPASNMLRTTNQVMAAVLGGADAVYSAPFDDAAGVAADDFSDRLARNIQLIIRDECAMGQVADAAGGSWYVESLTDQLMAAALDKFVKIERDGGMVAALQQGVFQRELAVMSGRRQEAVFHRKRVMIGVNAFLNPFDDGFDAVTKFAMDPEVATATTGAIQIDPVIPVRTAVPYEELQAAVARLRMHDRALATVLLVPVGDYGRLTPRMEFARGFFEAGGFTVEEVAVAAQGDDGARHLLTRAASVVVFCAADETYSEVARGVAAVRDETNVTVVFAGRPGEQEATFRGRGVDYFIYMGMDNYCLLRELLHRLGGAR